MKLLQQIKLLGITLMPVLILLNVQNMFAQDLNPAFWPHLKGYWKFQQSNNLTKATVGNDLKLVGTHKVVAGPSYGDTAIEIGIGSYYKANHNCAPNGGGDSVNRYTLMFDFKVLNLIRWHTFHQTDTTNTNDGECFIKPTYGTIGVGYTGYSLDSVLPNKWYRLVVTVNLGHFYDYYLNGTLIHKGDTDEIFIDKRFALTPMILFFADNNQEDDTIDIASVAIFDTCLSATDIARIGSIDPCVANPPRVNLGSDTSLCNYNNLLKSAGTGFKKYRWSTGDTLSSVTLSSSKLGMGKHNVWAKVTDVNGCTAADTFAVTYMSSPVVNLGANRSICNGSSTLLDAGNDTTQFYLWKHLPSGVTLSNSNSITVDSAGRYMATVSSSFGCIASDTIEIKILQNPPKPVITVTGVTAFCEGDSVILQAPFGYLQCYWQDGAGNVTRIIKSMGWFKVRVTDYSLCTSIYSDSVGITVLKNPLKPTINVIGNPEFCEGGSVILKVLPGFSAYRWQDGPGDSVRTVKQSGNFQVFYIDSNNCKGPVSDNVTVTVNKNPPKPVISVIGSPNLCHGDSVLLSAPSGYLKYDWSTYDSLPEIYIKNTKTLDLIVTDSNNCSSPVSDPVQINVYSNPAKPVIHFIGDSIVCEGKTISLTGPAGHDHYIWSTADTTHVISVISTQKISLIVEDFPGCKSPVSESVLAIVHAKPPKPTIIGKGDTLFSSVNGTWFKWYFSTVSHGSKMLFPNTNQKITDLWSPGYYYVVVVDSNGCLSDTSDGYYYNKGPIIEIKSESLSIYPNPTNGIFEINLNNINGSGNIDIKIFDVNSKNVMENSTTRHNYQDVLPVDIKGFPPGMYLVKLIISNQVYTGKILKY